MDIRYCLMQSIPSALFAKKCRLPNIEFQARAHESKNESGHQYRFSLCRSPICAHPNVNERQRMTIKETFVHLVAANGITGSLKLSVTEILYKNHSKAIWLRFDFGLKKVDFYSSAIENNCMYLPGVYPLFKKRLISHL